MSHFKHAATIGLVLSITACGDRSDTDSAQDSQVETPSCAFPYPVFQVAPGPVFVDWSRVTVAPTGAPVDISTIDNLALTAFSIPAASGAGRLCDGSFTGDDFVDTALLPEFRGSSVTLEGDDGGAGVVFGPKPDPNGTMTLDLSNHDGSVVGAVFLSVEGGATEVILDDALILEGAVVH